MHGGMNSAQKDRSNDKNTSAYGNFQRARGPRAQPPVPDAHAWSLIATFGGAQLWKNLNGRFEVRGGSDQEKKEAVEWVGMFLPEAMEHLHKGNQGNEETSHQG